MKQKYNAIQRELDNIRKDNQKLSEEKDIVQGVSDRAVSYTHLDVYKRQL